MLSQFRFLFPELMPLTRTFASSPQPSRTHLGPSSLELTFPWVAFPWLAMNDILRTGLRSSGVTWAPDCLKVSSCTFLLGTGPPCYVYSKGGWRGVQGLPCSVHSFIWLEDGGYYAMRDSHVDVRSFRTGLVSFRLCWVSGFGQVT